MTACNPGVFVNDIGPSAKELTFSAAGETKEIRFNSSDWGIIELRAGMNVLNVTVYPDNDEPFTTTFPKLYGTGRNIVDFGNGSEWKIVRPTGKSMVITSGRNNMSYYRCFSIILSNNVSQESIDILTIQVQSLSGLMLARTMTRHLSVIFIRYEKAKNNCVASCCLCRDVRPGISGLRARRI